MTQIGEPSLQLMKATDSFIDQNAHNKDALNVMLETVLLLCKIFHSLSAQDLPAFYEEHLGEYMTLFLKYLSYNNALIQSNVTAHDHHHS